MCCTRGTDLEDLLDYAPPVFRELSDVPANLPFGVVDLPHAGSVMYRDVTFVREEIQNSSMVFGNNHDARLMR